MLRSMTGFGKAATESRYGSIKIEIKSLNSKYFEVVSKLPVNLTIFEDKIRESLQKKIARGRLSLFLTYDKRSDKKDEVYIDKAVGRHYYEMISELKKSLKLGGEVGIEQIISLPGVVAYHPQEDDSKKLWPIINRTLVMAADDLIFSKEREGRMLKKAMGGIVADIGVSLNKIKTRAPLVVNDYKARLLKNIKTLTDKKRVFNHSRIEEEAAIFARNCDITEEVHRISSHIAGFKKVLSNHNEVGRRLDFIAQEIYREANTIGAKANDFFISKEMIKIKSLVEKIREQVQNVE